MDPMNNLIPSALCIAWIKHSEGCKLTAYWDVDGWSIGYGYHGSDVTQGMTWTQEDADGQLMSKVFAAGVAVNDLVKVELTQGQFDALTDFVYNEGSGNLQSSSLLRKVNAGLMDSARESFYYADPDGTPHGWIYAGGQVSPGLIARRKGDQILWDGGNPLEGA